MRARTKIATLLVAWLVIIPTAVLIPSSQAGASVLPEEDRYDIVGRGATELAFGQRISSGGSSSAMISRAAALPTERRLPRPDFQIWPDDSLNQVVNLESFLMITSGFRSKSWCWCFFFFTAHFQSTPLRSVFEFTETDTGSRTKVKCWGPGFPWVPGQTDAFCGKDWDHSSDVTGVVEAQARVEHLIVVTGDINLIYPAQSKPSATQTLEVGEVLNVGQTVTLPTNPTSPTPPDDGGFCDGWGINVLCWLGNAAYDAAVQAVLWAAPVLNEVVNFFEGCADGFLESLGGLADILGEIAEAITSPIDFVTEKVQEFRDLVALVKEATSTPEKAKEFALEVLGDLADLDTLENEGVAVWLGKVVCQLAIEYFTGKAVVSIIQKTRRFLRDRTPDGNGNNGNSGDNDGNNNDGNNNDGDDNDGNNPNPCPISSFPGDTLVLMSDGSYLRIDAIRPGDWVLSHQIDTGVWESGLVVDQWSHLDRGPPATATLTNGATITATDDHLFWQADAAEWTELRHLRAGDELLTPEGVVNVAGVVVGPRHDWTVWELTVEGNHNFTVAADDHDLLVHNRSCGEGATDNLGKPIPGTTRRIGDPPDMTNDSPRLIITDPGPPPKTQKPRSPSPDNPNFDHSKTKVDPVTGETTYFRHDGSSVTYDADGFPKFDSEMDVYLNADELGSNSSPKDFGSANDKVVQSLKDDPAFLDQFPQDVQDFYNQPTVPQKPPPGYTWHHHQDTGRMQLVPEGVHGDFPHTGGASIWGR